METSLKNLSLVVLTANIKAKCVATATASSTAVAVTTTARSAAVRVATATANNTIEFYMVLGVKFSFNLRCLSLVFTAYNKKCPSS